MKNLILVLALLLGASSSFAQTACSLFPPIISMRSGSNGPGPICTDSLLTGLLANAATFSKSRYFLIIDDNEIDSVSLIEIVNGVARPTVSLPAQAVNIYPFLFQNYATQDTVQWAIEAYDTCGSFSRFPATGYHTFTFVKSVAKCSEKQCRRAHKFIDDFPWKEDFDGTNWVSGNGHFGGSNRGVAPADEFYEFDPPLTQSIGWSVFNNPTVTIGSGPYTDHSSNNRDQYLYTEFDFHPTTPDMYFTLPCIDLIDSSHLTLSFYYHMHGIEIDKLSIEIDTLQGSTILWQPYFEINGQQQAAPTTPWKKATISLEPFLGKILKIRFHGSRITGTGSWADIAIDDLEIKEVGAIDGLISKIVSPTLTACEGTSSISVQIEVFNNGFDSLSTIPIAYQLDAGAIIRDTLFGATLAPTSSVNALFSQTLSYNPLSAHNLLIWTEIASDVNFKNDTSLLSVPVFNDQIINNFPYFMDFEDATVGTSTSFGNLNTGQWQLNDPSRSGMNGWAVEGGKFSNSLTGPPFALGKSGKAMVNGSSTNIYFDSIKSISGCIDLSGLTNPILNFQYYSALNGEPNIRVREFGQKWTSFPTTSSTFVSPKDKMLGYKVSLSAYAGKSIQIAFRASATERYMHVIDNITIREQPIADLELREVERGRLRSDRTVYNNTVVRLSNWGSINAPSYYPQLHVALINKCNPSASVIYGKSDSLFILPSTLGTNSTQTFSNLTFAQPVPSGEYIAKYWLVTSGDVFAENDTSYADLVCQKVITPPYFNDFESCEKEVYVGGPNNQWEITAPQKPSLSAAHSGNNCAITNADTNVISPNLSVEILELPPVQGLDTLYNTEIRFWQNFDFGPSIDDFGVVEILDGGFYKTLHNINAQDSNWQSLMTNTSNINYPLGFRNSSNGWVYSSYPLNGYNASGLKYFRFLSFANETVGWAIDDLEIYVPPQNSSNPTQLIFSSIPTAGSNQISLKFKNSGAAPLSQINVFIESAGTILHQEQITLPSPLASGGSITMPLAQPIGLNTGMQELLIRTSLPNNRLDAIPMDDTLRLPIKFTQYVDSLPQCFSFETSTSFLAYDLNIGSYDTSWTLGTPAKSQINSAHTGSKAWYIDDSLYDILLDKHLFTPIYPVEDNTCYRLSFWQNFDTELNFDGGNVEFSLDSGLTWQTLGKYWSTDSLWYNTQYVQSLDLSKPGFSGNSGGWIEARNEFNVFGNTSVQFRFRFSSNASISGEGWAIDDVCFEKVSTGCQTIGLESQEIIESQVYLYPIPSSSELNLRGNLKGNFNLSVFDQRGTLSLKWNKTLDPSEDHIIDISLLPAGMYLLQIEGTQAPIFLKFIKD